MSRNPKIVACALVALPLLALGFVPASAQTAPRPTIVAPYEVAAALQRLGLRPLASPQQRGWVWIAPAVTRDGDQVQVVVRAGSGEILDVDEIPYMPLAPGRPIVGVPGAPGPMRPQRPVTGTLEAPGPRVVMRDGRQIDLSPVPPSAVRPMNAKPRAVPLPKPRPEAAVTTAPIAPPAPPAPPKETTAPPKQVTAPVAAPTPAASTTSSVFPPVQGFE